MKRKIFLSTTVCILSAMTAMAQTAQTARSTETQVYYGVMGKFNETRNTALRSQWTYTREHVTGFYTNFIDAWQQMYQSGLSIEAMAQQMAMTFPGKRLFYEGTMENQVNDSPNGRTDKAFETKVFNAYQDAGFTIDYGAINYMSNTPNGTGGINDTHNSISECKDKIAHYRNSGVQKVLYLCGPWTSGSELYSNNDARTMASWTDGVLSDGPIGFWVADNGNYRRNSRNIVRYCREHGMTSALMICPYSVEGAGGYSPYNGGFLTAAKQHVFDQEDNGLMPDVWALWNYGGDEINAFNQFPESKTVDGAAQPQNTETGVAFWLLYHLNELPVATVTTLPSGATQPAQGVCVATVAKGEQMQVDVTLQSANKWIELAPVLHALATQEDGNWQFVYTLNGTDVTARISDDSGFNCVGTNRIEDGRPLHLVINATPLTDDAQAELRIAAMSNAANTQRSDTVFRLLLNKVFSGTPDDPDDPGTPDDPDPDSHIPADYHGTPWTGSPQAIPGKLQCEWFDRGGKNETWGWNDGPFAGQGRENGDGIQFIHNGIELGWLSSGDENWALYTVDIARENDYYVKSSTATIRLEIDGKLTEKGTQFDKVHLPKGRWLLKVWFYAGTGDADYIEFSEEGSDPVTGYQGTPWTGTPTELPGIVECEDFDRGGEGVAFKWQSNQSRASYVYRDDAAFIGTHANGYNVGWNDGADWAIYTVKVQKAGHYNVYASVASLNDAAALQLEVDGEKQPTACHYGVTGDSWDDYVLKMCDTVFLSEGQHLLKVYYTGTNADYLEFVWTDASGIKSAPVDSRRSVAAGQRSYNLGGQRTGTHQKGISITNGEKIIRGSRGLSRP